MIGLVLGIGPGWAECAAVAAGAMSRMTGIPCRTITDWPGEELIHPAWLKCLLPEMFPEDDLMIFDADLLCRRSWNPRALLCGYDLAWVIDYCPQVVGECVRLGLNPLGYGNSGLMLLRRGSTFLKKAMNYYPKLGNWAEQGAINRVVQDSPTIRIAELGRRYNTMIRKHQCKNMDRVSQTDATCLHFVGLRGDVARLTAIQGALECT